MRLLPIPDSHTGPDTPFSPGLRFIQHKAQQSTSGSGDWPTGQNTWPIFSVTVMEFNVSSTQRQPVLASLDKMVFLLNQS